jgi:stage II sporulation protein D
LARVGALALWMCCAGVRLAGADFQAAVTRAMAGKQGAAVVLDVKSGRVLASHRMDIAARSLVRPGSTIKPFVLAAALERGRVRASESMLCRREVRIAGRNLDCSHGGAGMPLAGAQALAYSCNHFFAQVGLRFGPGELAQALRRAIPAGPTGLAKDEAASSIEEARSPEERQLQALGEAAVRVTPFAMLAAYRRLALARAPAAVVEGLEGAARFGTARMARAEGIAVAGKTGTSTGVEAQRRYAWFVGYAPADAPSIAVLVFLEQGRGGADAAPVAGEILAALRPARAGDVTVRRYWAERRASAPIALSMGEYVAAVLAGEANGFGSMESLKAMAVAVRSYAQANRGRHAREGFDFCDTTHCQDYRGVAVGPRVKEAASATTGEVLWHGGAVASVFYSADCGGMTEAVERVWPGLRAPFLQSHADPYCVRRGQEEWDCDLRKADVVRALKAEGLKTPDPLLAVRVVGRAPSGRVERLELSGAGSAAVAASSFWFAVGRVFGWNLVRSTWFEVRDAGDRVVFHGRGRGHGVGLCQAGAARMGEEGAGYREILAFYFPGTEVRAEKKPVEWHGVGGERVEVLSTHPASDREVVGMADALVREIEARTGQPFASRPQVRVYPSVAVFRDDTGEPGWVAASTRGRVIRLQPVRVLGSRLRATLRHELLHVWVEGRARPGLPLWFREGLALYLAEPQRTAGADRVEDGDFARARSREELDAAYGAARSRVKRLVERNGEPAVLGWLAAGLPGK